MSKFSSLTWFLERWYDAPYEKLPARVQKRVARDFPPIHWDNLTPSQRRLRARQWDYAHDPATDAEREYWLEFSARYAEVQQRIREWETVATVSASELTEKENRLTELGKSLARMDAEARNGVDRYSPPRPRRRDKRKPLPVYLPYPKALTVLKERLDASPGELAVWIFLGPDLGGLAAYRNANELDPPPRFYFESHAGTDYRAAMMVCWFEESELRAFDPVDRYITGLELLTRWRVHDGLDAGAFVLAKVAESRLQDIHPITGLALVGEPDSSHWLDLVDAFFSLSEIEAIESEDFGVHREQDVDKDEASGLVLGSSEWRSERARAAANARHNKPGGSREKRALLVEIWRSGKYDSKDRCAEEECRALDLSPGTARKILKGI